MAILNTRTETVQRVGANEVSCFIKECTGHEYDVQCNEEMHDSEHRFDITGKLHDYELGEWNKFKAEGVEFSFMLRTILNGLCADGFLPAAIYLISSDN
jgi:hypothetical protein